MSLDQAKADFKAAAEASNKAVTLLKAQTAPTDPADLQRYNSNNAPVYPTGLAISADGDTLFVANNLGPALNQAGLHPVVLGVDFNTNVMSNFGVPLLNDTAAAQYLAGTAWHCYAGNLGAQGSMHNSFPTKDVA